MEVNGNISYASQEPWIFPATVRQNILFSRKYDQKRYDEVVRICALEYDFSLLDEGDQTVLSDRGQNLSKGQQARINLARAVYRDTNIYLLDDSLTALDARVQDYIFNECILKFLKDKIVILVSQNPIHIRAADHVFVLNEGRMETATGDIEDLKVRKNSCVKEDFDKTDHNNDREKGYEVKKRKLSKAEQQQKRNIYKEVQKTGGIDLNIYQKYFQYGGGYIALAAIFLIYFFSQLCESYGDKLMTKW